MGGNPSPLSVLKPHKSTPIFLNGKTFLHESEENSLRLLAGLEGLSKDLRCFEILLTKSKTILIFVKI